MPQKVIKFTGINRKVNEFQGSGACEELINLRPTIVGGHSVVRPKKAIESDIDYESIYEHSFGNTYNRIAVTHGGRIVWVNGNNSLITSDFIGDKSIEFSSAGNVLVIYSESKKEQRVFKFEDEEYKSFDVLTSTIEDVTVSYNVKSGVVSHTEIFLNEDSYDNFSLMHERLNTAIVNFYNKYPEGLCGSSIIGCTYELDDGTEIWSTAFVLANVERCSGYIPPAFFSTGVTPEQVKIY